MGIISLNSPSSWANCTDSSTVIALFRCLRSAGCCHQLSHDVSRPFKISWHLHQLQWLRRWMMVQWLLRSTFGCFFLHWLCGFRFLLGWCGLHNNIPIKALFQNCLTCHIQYGIVLSFTGYNITRVVKHLCEWVTERVRCYSYDPPNKSAGSCPIMQHLSFLIRHVHNDQASEQMAMLWWYLYCRSMADRLWNITDYRFHRSAVCEIDCCGDCMCPVLFQMSSIIQHALYALHDHVVGVV